MISEDELADIIYGEMMTPLLTSWSSLIVCTVCVGIKPLKAAECLTDDPFAESINT